MKGTGRREELRLINSKGLEGGVGCWDQLRGPGKLESRFFFSLVAHS